MRYSTVNAFIAAFRDWQVRSNGGEIYQWHITTWNSRLINGRSLNKVQNDTSDHHQSQGVMASIAVTCHRRSPSTNSLTGNLPGYTYVTHLQLLLFAQTLLQVTRQLNQIILQVLQNIFNSSNKTTCATKTHTRFLFLKITFITPWKNTLLLISINFLLLILRVKWWLKERDLLSTRKNVTLCL